MPRGNYKSKNRAAILYIKEILENFSSIEKPLSNAQIRKILAEQPYNMEIHRETVKETLDELAAYDSDLYKCETSNQKGRDGYSFGWYYNRPSSINDSIKAIIEDLDYNLAIPSDIAQSKSEALLSLISQVDETFSINENIVVKQNQLNNETYQILNQLKQIIIENKNNLETEKNVRFRICRYIMEDKNTIINKSYTATTAGVPLAIVEWNHNFWFIYYEKQRDIIMAARVDLMCDFKVIEGRKEYSKQQIKMIEKISDENSIKEFMYQYMRYGPNQNKIIGRDPKIYTCTLKITKDRDITYFYELFNDNFKIIKENDRDYIVKVKCSKETIESIIYANIDLIEILEPEEIVADITRKLDIYVGRINLNTNWVLVSPMMGRGYEKLSQKVTDDEKWFYVDFDYYPDKDKTYMGFVDYLSANGFKEKAMKKRYKDAQANRYLVTNEYDSYQEILKLIKKYIDKNNKNKWFYRYIKSYSIYEYKDALVEKDIKKTEKRFLRVYYYKGDTSVSRPTRTYSEDLKLKHIRKKEESNVK